MSYVRSPAVGEVVKVALDNDRAFKAVAKSYKAWAGLRPGASPAGGPTTQRVGFMEGQGCGFRLQVV